MGEMWNRWLYQIPGPKAGQAGSQPSLWAPGKDLRAWAPEEVTGERPPSSV